MQTLASWNEQYGPIYRWRLATKDIVVVTDPAEMLKLCSKEADLPKFKAMYKAFNTVIALCRSLLAWKHCHT